MKRLKTIAKLLVVSVVISTGSSAFAAQAVHHDPHCHSCEEKAHHVDAPHSTAGNAAHGDWPAEMILG
jgi:hypothetical protein